MFVVVVPVAVATWLVSAPRIGASSFLALLALVTAFGWVVHTTYRKAMPASSLAQSLHDADHDSSSTGQRRHG
jgi:hypothetical protein